MIDPEEKEANESAEGTPSQQDQSDKGTAEFDEHMQIDEEGNEVDPDDN
jgi:hypothetical protein